MWQATKPKYLGISSTTFANIFKSGRCLLSDFLSRHREGQKKHDLFNRWQMGRTPVREAIGSLRYLIAPTKGDIACAANQVSAFVSDLGPGLWEAIKRIFAYLSGTTNYVNLYGSEWMRATNPLIGCTGADLYPTPLRENRLLELSFSSMIERFHGEAHITQVRPMVVQKMSNSDIGHILWMPA